MSTISSAMTSERFVNVSPGLFSLNVMAIQQVAAGGVPRNNPAVMTHPLYDLNLDNWGKWRLLYEGGDCMIDEYLSHFSNREEREDFNSRKRFTPTPSFSKAAVNEIKNAIFQRMADVSRKGGSVSYTAAVEGDEGGVDLRGAKMNWFIGHNVLPELLTMSKVGVYVDNFEMQPGESLATKGSKHPYLYVYKAEDIRSWTKGTYGAKSEYTALLLRDYNYIIDEKTGLPVGEIPVFRYLWINPEDNKVWIQFYGELGQPIGEPKALNIDRIPFVEAEINDSLLKDVANHQIALLNLESSDVAFILKGNFPFYIEQYDPTNKSTFTKSAQDAFIKQFGAPTNADGTSAVPIQVVDEFGIQHSTMGGPADIAKSYSHPPDGDEVEVGATQGRRYPMGTDAPAFIAPPTEPIKASIAKQEQLKEDIRKLVQLAVTNTRSQGVSAESKGFDQQGLEAGLSYIGLELEHLENKIAEYWAMYEASTTLACVRYPKHYSLKSPQEIEKEIGQAFKVRDEIPSKTFKSEMNKEIARMLLQTKVSDEVLTKIYGEIMAAKFYTSNPDAINADVESGLVSVDTGSQARGWPAGESDKAATDHAEKLARIEEAQASAAIKTVAKQTDEAKLGGGPVSNPAARGISSKSATPAADARAEKTGKPKRGKGRKVDKNAA